MTRRRRRRRRLLLTPALALFWLFDIFVFWYRAYRALFSLRAPWVFELVMRVLIRHFAYEMSASPVPWISEMLGAIEPCAAVQGD